MWRVIAIGGLLVGCRFGFDGGDPPVDVDVPDDARVDATRSFPPDGSAACDDPACTAAGGTCIAGVCELVASSESVLACPAGMPCRLICEGYRFCRDGARCDGTPWCEVACVGYRACQFGVSCGDAQCTITCNGEEACEDGITVDPGGTCTSHCCGIEACALGVDTCVNDANC